MRSTIITLLFIIPFCTFGQTGNISASKVKGCVPFNVTFSCSKTNIASYQWEFGNGTTSVVAVPTILFETPGNYTVKLTAVLTDGQTKEYTLSQNIQAISKPLVSFDSETISTCIDTPVQFSNTTTGAVKYLWDFGDGNTSTQKNPGHKYLNPGKYSVSLISYNEMECSTVLSKSNYIEVRNVPKIEITTDKKQVCLNEPTVKFGTKTEFSAYNWNFNDGQTSNEQAPIHSYTTAGLHTINLDVTAASGCKASTSLVDFINVYNQPQLKVVQSDSVICQESSITFTGEFESGFIKWVFDDGYISNDKIFTRTFNSVGQYSYKVELTNENGCIISESKSINVLESSNPQIALGETAGCSPFVGHLKNNTPDVSQVIWKINSKEYTGNTVDIPFNSDGYFSLDVLLYYKSGCVKDIHYDSAFNIGSSYNEIISSTYKACSPATIDFQLVDTSVSNIIWDFENGKSSNKLNPQITFNTPGEYEVSVTFDNKFGCTQTVNLDKSILINSEGIDYTAPTEIITCESAEVYFDGGIGKDIWMWDFGDGNTSEEKNPSHFYNDIGTYTVSLITNNSNGCETSIENYNTITVNQLDLSISAAVVDTTKGCPDFTVQFNSNTNSPVSSFWDFGHDLTSTESNPLVDFSTNSQLNVKLTVIDNNGCSKAESQLINSPWLYCESNDGEGEVSNLDETLFLIKQQIEMCGIPANVNFANPRSQANSWVWDFGDNNSSTEKTPSHSFTEPGVYNVDLLSYYSDGKIDTLNDFIEVTVHQPSANFTYLQKYSCPDYIIDFNTSGANLFSWEWDFGDGNSSLNKNPSHNYSSPGLYQVSLTSTTTTGCKAKVIKNILVGNDFLNFDYPTNLCEVDVLTINHNLQGFDGYKWDFGDGEVSTKKFPSHNYKISGIYQVKLEVTTNGACKEVFLLPEPVQYNKPIAEFNVNQTTACNSLTVNFNNTSKDANRSYWSFGDETYSFEKNPFKRYNSGIYDVSLTVSSNGCSNTRFKKSYIKVDSIYADFDFIKEQNCLPTQVHFTDKSVNSNSWNWNFGDGNASKKRNPVHLYESLPTSAISLTITNSAGCEVKVSKTIGGTLSINFDVDKKVVCRGQEISFINKSTYTVKNEWDFGDGTISTLMSPKHSYAKSGYYNVKLTVTGADGCKLELTKQQLIKVDKVQPDFTVTGDNTGCSPLLVNFINTTKEASKFYWDFGDNSYSESVNPSHVYTSTGHYDVRLIAINDLGCADTTLFENAVTATGPNSQIIVSDSVICNSDTINFDDQSTTSISWEWLFGDGNVSDLKNPSYTYEEPGKYSVSLLTSDSDGCSQLVKYDSIKVIARPNVSIDLEEYANCLPVSIKTINKSTKLQNPKFNWIFGDGNQSELIEPEHIYNQSGTYQISLEVTNEGLCTNRNQIDETIYVYDTAFLPQPEIFRLSVANSKEIEVNCDPYEANNFKYVVAYRKSELEESFTPYDTLTSPSASFYTDNNAYTDKTPYLYIFQSHVYCHDPVQIEELDYYKSIHVMSKIDKGKIQLIWNHYKGHQFDHYRISRKSEGGTWQEIAKVSNNEDSFIDDEDLCPGKYEYQISAANLAGSDYFSESNLTTAEVIKNVFTDQQVQIVRTTVVDDRYTYTEWKEPEIGPDKVVYYEVLRSDPEGFNVIDQVPAGVTSYYDENVDVQSGSFVYKVKVVNECDIETQLSNVGKSILLQKETDNYKSRIYWTPYEGWEKGVGSYKLQRLNDFGVWETIKELDSLKFETVIDLSEND